jgi:hypothetical protein
MTLDPPPRIGAAIIGQKARPVGRDELIREMGPHTLGAETGEVEVEVAMDRHELADFDTGGEAAFSQPVGGLETGDVVVAGDIEAEQRRYGASGEDKAPSSL